jgi:hypothetical protein
MRGAETYPVQPPPHQSPHRLRYALGVQPWRAEADKGECQVGR